MLIRFIRLIKVIIWMVVGRVDVVSIPILLYLRVMVSKREG
jgi:hypothetical protein